MMRKFDDLIVACEGRVRPAPHEYPAHDYPWGIREVGGVDELVEAFRFGNYCVRTGFVLDDLAFIEQVSGGNEWLALKRDNGEWKSFDSISFYHMIEQSGADACGEFIEYLRETPWHDLKYPSGPRKAEPEKPLFMPADGKTIAFSIVMLYAKEYGACQELYVGGAFNSYYVTNLPGYKEFLQACPESSEISVDVYSYELCGGDYHTRKATKEEMEQIFSDGDFPNNGYGSELCVVNHEGPDQFKIYPDTGPPHTQVLGMSL